ncbi:MAG: sulfurtransferase [Thiohalorhabdus sp.]
MRAGALTVAGVLALSGCGDEADNKTVTEYMTGTSDPVNYNDPSTVERPSGVDSYADSASVIPDEDFAVKQEADSEAELQSPAEIAEDHGSDDPDYSNNTNGLITAGTLADWMDEWANNKPNDSEGNPIAGDLVILEVNDGGDYDDDGTWTGGGIYFQEDTGNTDGENVRTYVVSGGEVSETRNNGAIDSVSMVLSESSMNDLMAKYDVDPTEDMVVVAMGEGGGPPNMQMGRLWYALRYWGAPADHLALLNGGAQWNTDEGPLTDTDHVQIDTDPADVVTGHYNPDIADGSVDLSEVTAAADLPEANMDLMASYEDMLDVAKANTTENLIWDARSPEEYYGLENQGRGYAFEGHVRGAENLPYDQLLVADEGWRYLDKDSLQDKLDSLGYEDGQTVYTYCVTTYRAMITGIASGVVLGKPTRFYDGAWTQWGQMAYHENKEGTYNLASDSPWRADIPEASRWISYDPDADDSDGSSDDDDDVDVPEQGCG